MVIVKSFLHDTVSFIKKHPLLFVILIIAFIVIFPVSLILTLIVIAIAALVYGIIYGLKSLFQVDSKYQHGYKNYNLTTNEINRIKLLAQNLRTISPIQYEEYVALIMKGFGYLDLSFTKTSGDFGADILATAVSSNVYRVCVQCKHYQEHIGVKAVQEIYAAKAYYGCYEAWVCGLNGFTRNAVELANRLNVKLYTVNEEYARNLGIL